MNSKKTGIFSIVFIVLLLFIDQASKFYVKLNYRLGEETKIFDWFVIHFTENEGMAFGWTLPFGDPALSKLILSVFRIIAISGIAYLVYDFIKKQSPLGLVMSMCLIFAGALGNILDSIFYGVIFSDSYYHVAKLFPEAGGYAEALHGRVVDMLYFPLVKGYFPDWSPIYPGDYFIFFRPVFNLADSMITIGVSMILLFNKKYFPKK